MKKIGLLLVIVMALFVFSFTACGDKKHTHALTELAETKATCETAGNIKYYTCSCGKFFADADAKTEIAFNSWVIPATGHTLTEHVAKQPTCEDFGTDKYYSCTCGKFFSDAEGKNQIAKDSWIITSTGHILTKHPANAADCYNNGNTEYYSCTCGKFFSDERGRTEIAENSWVILASHNPTEIGATANTCDTDGNSTYYACVCGKFFSDKDATNEIAENSWVITKSGHAFDKTGKCTNDNCDATATTEQMVQLGYIAKANNIYYTTISEAVTNAGSKKVTIIADSDEDITINTNGYVLVASGVNYTGTVTKPEVVDIESDLKVYVGSFNTAWTYYSTFSPTTNDVTFKLLSDLTTAKQFDVRANDTDLTIDLNGKTLTTTQNSYTELFLIKSTFTLTSSVSGAKIELNGAGFAQIQTSGILEVSNVAINQTTKSGKDFILNYGIANIGANDSNVTITTPELSKNLINTYGTTTLGKNLVVNVNGKLGTSIVNMNGSSSTTMNGSTINISSFKVNAGSLLYRSAGSSLVIDDINLTLVVDETYTSYCLNIFDPSKVQINDGTYNITGTKHGALNTKNNSTTNRIDWGITLVETPAQPATCTTPGNTAYYPCVCGKYFSDANHTTEIEKDSWVIAPIATAHEYEDVEYYDNNNLYVKKQVCKHNDSHVIDNIPVEVTNSTIADVLNPSIELRNWESYNLSLKGNFEKIEIGRAGKVDGIGDGTSASPYLYNRIINKLSFDGNNEAIVNGFEFSFGALTYNPTYYFNSIYTIETLEFKNITFTNVVKLASLKATKFTDKAGLNIKNVIFDNVTFDFTSNTTTAQAMLHIQSELGGIENLTIKNCNFSNAILDANNTMTATHGILFDVRSTDNVNITIENNTITNIKNNPIQLSGSGSKFDGTIVIKDNKITNSFDRAIRISTITANCNLTITGNIMTNASDTDGEMCKMSITEGATITINGNYWKAQDGLEVSVIGIVNSGTGENVLDTNPIVSLT